MNKYQYISCKNKWIYIWFHSRRSNIYTHIIISLESIHISDLFTLLIYDVNLHYCKYKLTVSLNTYGIWGLISQFSVF